MAKKQAPPLDPKKILEPTLGDPGYYTSLVRRVWQQLQSNPRPALLYALLYTVAAAISQTVQHSTSLTNEHYRAYESIVNLVFIATLPLYGLALADGKHLNVNEFTYIQPRQFFYALGGSIILGVLVLLSFFALFIPLIWVIGWFALTLYPLVDQNMTPLASLQASRLVSQNHKRHVWGVSGIIILIAVPLILLEYIPYVGSLGIGLFTVISVALYANLYRDLEKAV